MCCLTAFPLSTVLLAGGLAAIPRDEISWLEHHERLNIRARKGGIDLLFIGDSLTHRWSGDGETVWNAYYSSVGSANFGISGDRVENVLWRVQNGNLDGVVPKVVVLLIGTNNLALHTPQQIAGGIAALLDEIHAQTPGSHVLLLALFPRGERANDLLRRQVEAVNQLILQMGSREKVSFLDIGSSFLLSDGSLDLEVMPDGLHLSTEGYERWAKAMKAKLDELLQ